MVRTDVMWPRDNLVRTEDMWYEQRLCGPNRGYVVQTEVMWSEQR